MGIYSELVQRTKNQKIGLMYKVITSYVSFLLLKVEWIYYYYYYYYSRSYFLSEVDKVIFCLSFSFLHGVRGYSPKGFSVGWHGEGRGLPKYAKMLRK